MPENTSDDPQVRIALGLSPIPEGALEAEGERWRRFVLASDRVYRETGTDIDPRLLVETAFDPDR